jgi:hypothetical protein
MDRVNTEAWLSDDFLPGLIAKIVRGKPAGNSDDQQKNHR